MDVLPNYVELLLEFDEFAGGGGVGGLDAGKVEARKKGAGVDGDWRLGALGLKDNCAVYVVNSD